MITGKSTTRRNPANHCEIPLYQAIRQSNARKEAVTMLLRSVLLILVCALAGCGRQPGSTAMASSEPVKLTFSPEPGVRSGYVRIRPNKIGDDPKSVEWEWRIKGEGLPGGAKFYNSRMIGSGTGPVTLSMQISGSVGFDARVVLKLTEESGQVKADQRVEISAGRDMGKVEEKSWM